MKYAWQESWNDEIKKDMESFERHYREKVQERLVLEEIADIVRGTMMFNSSLGSVFIWHIARDSTEWNWMPSCLGISTSGYPIEMVIDMICSAFKRDHGCLWTMKVTSYQIELSTRLEVFGRKYEVDIYVSEGDENSCKIIEKKTSVMKIKTEYFIDCAEAA